MPVGASSSPGSVIMVDCMAFPSWLSRLTSPAPECSGCGFRVKKSLSQRTHSCPRCGLVLDRDQNAALNILLAALASLAAKHRTAGQVETGLSQEGHNASG